MKNNLLGILMLLLLLGLSSCRIVDIRTSSLSEGVDSTLDRGRSLLEASIKAMGYDNLKDFETYSVKSMFEWKPLWSMMPMNALPGNKNKEIEFHFAIGSFDGRVDYGEGRKKGDFHGIQSWQSYQSVNAGAIEFSKDKRRSWGLASYHYMIEAPIRLLGAPIVKYAGSTKMYGKEYDLVFVTWGTEKANKGHDQWLVYINKETKFIDLTQLTIRDFFLPFPANMAHGTVLYRSRTAVNGVHLPGEIAIQLMKPKKHQRYIYKFRLFDYQFDKIPSDHLHPNPAIESVGDSKILN